MIIVTGILSFWLFPGINKANTAKYERVYEDTFTKTPVRSLPDESDTTIRRLSVKKPKYLKQEIVPKKGVKHLDVEMFSRATHFREKVLVIDDSVKINEDVVFINREVVFEQPISIADSASVDMAASNDVKEFK
jgi:hypothetical protein